MGGKSERYQAKKLKKLIAKFTRANPDKSVDEVHGLVRAYLVDSAPIREASRLRRIRFRPRRGQKVALCPQCSEELSIDLEELLEHFSISHGRVPSEGEVRQFASGGPNGSYYYSGTDFIKPRNEISGGGVSPK